ncbi:MAG TPA: SUMF1/EgtB/PvdO family nonheme iron enzyme [Haliscomenobacter sp.]|uniref:SUMF1/EgtB/PvdO family nonheme iron enzyme n=1 Tax=Haliscomenobacter sp. TaxID=2717303 RepID=UPI002BDCDFB3|nr:SUMF1/EgtB/PvdO family nonheme iron enzyme [Haliscomenobacter sp.]HOY20740.1 SUMF1/EgtB/PvdO family nonheme iron enzyme [Haliscomenobacter sp.]
MGKIIAFVTTLLGKKQTSLFLSSITPTCILLFIVTSCALEKEPLLPDGYTNETDPVFSSVEVTAITYDSIQLKAKLSSKGNLNIIQYGWVWSEMSNPSLKTSLSISKSEKLIGDYFETIIHDLKIGKTYYIKPFITNGSGTVYGSEKSITIGLSKIDNLVMISDSACFLDIRYNVQAGSKIMEHGLVYQEGTDMPNLQNSSKKLGTTSSNEIFSTQLSGLKPLTLYSIRAYSLTSSGVSYSRTSQFKTTNDRPLVELDFSINTDTILFKGAIVQFTNRSNGASTYTWNFGNGQTSLDYSTVHTFETVDNIVASLVGEKQGCKYSKTINFKVLPNPFENYWAKLGGGSFIMGCNSDYPELCDPDESPAHKVTLNPFEIGKTEVTQRQWIAVMGYNASFFKDCGLDCPVELVDYYNILRNFIPTLNRRTGRIHRLPTEAEWEYAAQGGQSYLYAGSNNLSEVGWHADNSDGKTNKVGLKKPNGYGLFDMTGNVWEWCSDYYSPTYYANSPILNPQGPSSSNLDLRIRRGGSFDTDNFDYCRVSYRRSYSHFQANYTTGFRLIRVN